jgi:uncharacterized protein YndB with AHSA1/START domain
MIESTGQAGAVSRRVDAGTVTISQTYDTTVDDLWDACTNPDRIPRWFIPVSGDLRLGGQYQLEGNAGGTIERCDRPVFFRATWEYGGETSWIEVRIEATPDGRARLELAHIGAGDSERWAEFGPGAVGVGWDLTLLGLAIHLRTGADIDPAEVGPWMASADGATFMQASSDGWCAAHVAAGTGGDEAKAAAARTKAAYTGSE